MTSTNSAAPRLTVGVVGTGRAGSVLGAALTNAGHTVVAAYGVSDLSRLRAEALLPGVPLVTPEEVFAAADLVLLTVPDDVLPELIAG
ncbi:MAG: NAD(P)-binding domain-containing protein, partial [Actinobacteria bacterium]|nr:NAD(P)-binding domain-containing protein [Actinomycetota bacterium]